jgi:hypothetical protein
MVRFSHSRETTGNTSMNTNPLTLRNLFILNCIVAFSYGLGALLSPAWVMSAYGLSLNAAGELMTRFYAAELIAHGWLTWQARNAVASEARQAVISSRAIGNAVRTAVSIMFFVSGQADWRGLLIIALFGFFALAYAYFWFFKRNA